MMSDPSSAAEAQALDALGARFLQALADKDAGRFDQAEDALRDVIRGEPRLPEPHMELARLMLDTDRLDDAESHAREALAHLQASGPWTEDLPPQVVEGLAHGLLAEILRRRADEDDVLFGDPERFRALLDEARRHFETAASLDPDDSYASFHAFFLGQPGITPPGAPEDDAADEGSPDEG